MRRPLEYGQLGLTNKLGRLAWRFVWIFFFRPSPRLLHGWRRFLLRLFGAQISRHSYIYPSVQVWAPWNLKMDDYSCLSHFVDCYSVDKIQVGRHATVSQYSYLCSASHDYHQSQLPLVTAPIVIGDYAWLMADTFVGPGVTIGEGAVVAARSTVIRDIDPWAVVAGLPARKIGERNRSAFIKGNTLTKKGDDA